MICRVVTFYGPGRRNGPVRLCELWFGKSNLPSRNGMFAVFFPAPFDCAHCRVAEEVMGEPRLSTVEEGGWENWEAMVKNFDEASR